MGRFRFTQQFDKMDCGPACIRMVAMHYGKTYSLSSIRKLSHLSREGVSIAGIRHAMEQIGLKSKTYEMDLNQLCEMCPLPAILHWNQNHFVVLYDIRCNRKGNKRTYRIADPAFGKTRMTEKEFSNHWLNGGRGIVVAIEPTDEFHTHVPEKEPRRMSDFLKRYVWPFRKDMSKLAAGVLVSSLLSLVAPFLTQAVVDDGIGQRNIEMITALLLAQLAVFLGSFAMNTFSSWITLHLGTKININVLHDYLSKLLRLPIIFFDTKGVGDFSQRIEDHNRLRGFATQETVGTLFSLLSGMVLLVAVGYYSKSILGLYMLITIFAIGWIFCFWSKRKALDYESFRASAKNREKMFELISGIVDVKVNSYSAYKVAEWEGIQQELYQTNKRSLKLGQIQEMGYALIGSLRNILITYLVARDVVDGSLTLGMMMSISVIIGQLNAPMSQLIAFLQKVQEIKVSLERSEEVHSCDDEDEEFLADIPNTAPQDFSLSDISFSYAGSIGKKALDHINLVIPAGKMTAIVGESGSGKTTLMKLLLKFYSPTEGTITLGGKDIALFKADSIRKNTGIVMQDNYIFGDTIRQNIILGEPYDESRLRKAVEMACLDDFINSLPLGLNTKIGADGIGISGGEKQRMMIARALYKQPLYLMLDEATSSLDAENERKITENITTDFKGCTMLVIAHRLSTVRNADNIIVLHKGKVAEQGTHEELTKKKGLYYDLVRRQLELSE